MTVFEILTGFFIWAVDTIKDEPSWILWSIGLGTSAYMTIDEMLNILLDVKHTIRKQVRARRG